MTTIATDAFEDALSRIVQTLDVADGVYEAAIERYTSVGQWLDREASTLRGVQRQIYPQGSFALGTVIQPVHENDDHDLDVVCQLKMSKQDISQQDLKTKVGAELRAYAKARNMNKPVHNGRRCWRLEYADESRFHMDFLPAIPDSARIRALLEKSNVSAQWSDSALAITDKTHWAYTTKTLDWPRSNPDGYRRWFQSRMGGLFEEERAELARRTRSQVHEVPEYRVKTPLQRIVQLLKRHRDIMFGDDETAPISVIIATLAGHAYKGQRSLGRGLLETLAEMPRYMAQRLEIWWIPNPTDPLENFADKWADDPRLQRAFFDWHRRAVADFEAMARATERSAVFSIAEKAMGKPLIERASGRNQTRTSLLSTAASAIVQLFSVPWRQAPEWPVHIGGDVTIHTATLKLEGGGSRQFPSNGPPIPKHYGLRFEASTNVAAPYQVFWQVVNTGDEAKAKNDLRGKFHHAAGERALVREENTRYSGTHCVECFIIKNGVCVARSGPFVVNIA